MPDTAGERQVADRVGQELTRLIRLVTHVRQHSDIGVAHVLVQLVEHGPQRVGAIACAVGSDPSTVSRKVTTLVDAGLVERRADPDDGRAQLLAATEAGVRRCDEGRGRRTDFVAGVLTEWPGESRLLLADLLGRFADDLQAAATRPRPHVNAGDRSDRSEGES